MTMEHSVCDDPDKCSAIIHLKNKTDQVHNDYEKSQESLDNNTKELTQTNLNLVELTTNMNNICRTFEKAEKDNKEEHDSFFNRTRKEETTRITDVAAVRQEIADKLTDVKVKQAVKLSSWDLIKIISAIGVLFGLFKYFG